MFIIAGNADNSITDENASASDVDIGVAGGATKGKDGKTKRRVSLRKIQDEQDEFTKNFNNIDKMPERQYTSRRMKNYDD